MLSMLASPIAGTNVPQESELPRPLDLQAIIGRTDFLQENPQEQKTPGELDNLIKDIHVLSSRDGIKDPHQPLTDDHIVTSGASLSLVSTITAGPIPTQLSPASQPPVTFTQAQIDAIPVLQPLTSTSSSSRVPSPTGAAFSGISNHRTESYRPLRDKNVPPMPPIDYRAVAEVHFHKLDRYLQAYLAKPPPNLRSTARQKLTRLTIQQFHELSTDVYDEIVRRKNEKEGTPSLANLVMPFSYARQKLATLPVARMEDLSSDVHFELARRYPEFAQKRLKMNDFNGHHVYVPLELCQSWTDLCTFLENLLRGKDESYFISSRNFGIRVPNEVDLLSGETWHLWVNRYHEHLENVLAALDLYAIMRDDSDSCPRCNTSSPVKHPLPDNLQRCANCQFTFLEVYRDMEVGPATLSTAPDTAGKPLPPISDSSEDHGKHVLNAGESSLVSNSTREQLDSTSVSRNPDGQISSAVQFPRQSVPRNVQMIRRRKPVVPDSEDPQISTEDTLLPTTSITSLIAAHPPRTPANYLKYLHALYGFVLFGLPDRYFRDIPTLPCYPDGSTLFKRWINEWTQMGTVAGMLFGLLFTVLQISSAAYDPVVRTVVQLAMVCLFFGAIYAFILSATFGKLETDPEGIGWIRQLANHPPKNTLWNTWIMLSLPLAWIIWGVIYFTLFMLVFFWRSGASNEPDDNSKPSPKQEYGTRVITTLMMIVGTVYLVLMIMAVKSPRSRPYIELRNVAGGPS
ncbi:hypothetical protein MVEN_01196200 [Mycena venus]|uniref:GIT Spa2 homology (SHD) domain-containing protein n=1 Tax=Mycena venus TaxID=2733690 RepID=A0A8H6Y626_9AGAR|nr:hypothetical protein MVEN_01196200 [Mycena venus]